MNHRHEVLVSAFLAVMALATIAGLLHALAVP